MDDRTLPVIQDPRPDPALPGISGLDPDELADLLEDLGEPPFRARQVADAVWRSPASSWEEVSTLARPLRATLAERFSFDTVADTDIREADGGATEKALHRLADGRLVESVLMHYPARAEHRERNTLCISSQAGCAVGCPFCATGELGFGRDLEIAEIVDQVRHARRRLTARGRHLTNLVFMGMGEPLLNLDAVVGAASALTDPERYGLGARHITISTSGVVPAMGRLTALRPQWTLAVSLHAARNPLRDLLVPLNRRWPVEDVVVAAREYARATGRRVSYEYVMIAGINDTDADADALVRLLQGPPTHVNCIPMNPVAHTPWEASSPERIAAFAARVGAGGIGVTVRRNRGAEVGAACGQLAAEQGGEPPAPEVARRRERLVEASAAALAASAATRPVPVRSKPGSTGPRPGSARPRSASAGSRAPFRASRSAGPKVGGAATGAARAGGAGPRASRAGSSRPGVPTAGSSRTGPGGPDSGFGRSKPPAPKKAVGPNDPPPSPKAASSGAQKAASPVPKPVSRTKAGAPSAGPRSGSKPAPAAKPSRPTTARPGSSRRGPQSDTPRPRRSR